MEVALNAAEEAVRREPESAGNLDTLAHVYHKLERYGEAVETQKKAIRYLEDDKILDSLSSSLELFQLEKENHELDK